MDLAPLLLIIVGILMVAIIVYLMRYPANITSFFYLLLNIVSPRKKRTPAEIEQQRQKAIKEMASVMSPNDRKKLDFEDDEGEESLYDAPQTEPAPSKPTAASEPVFDNKPQPARGESAKTAEEVDDGFVSPEPEPLQQEQHKPGAAILDDLLIMPEEAPKPAPPVRPQSPVTSTGTFGGVPPMQSPSNAAETQPVQVSAYYPKEVKPADWQPVHAYMFRQSASDSVSDDAAKQLGARKSEFRAVGRTAGMPIQEGALVVATPNLPGFEFNPPTAQIRFYKDWHRFDFEARAKDAPLNQSTNGFITFTVEGIIVADVPISIYVGESVSQATQPTMTSAKMYQAIFCSYSHQDTSIVERAERVYKALGLDFLRDVMSLKSGQEWSDELLTLISRADVFQLFWSTAAAQSQHVRFEWEHALKLAAEREHFIRPVYWETPNPPIPPELNHIHFAYQPNLTE